ncbi:MAG: helix-turn-helix domain-containing protein [Planctomycetia bacterium]|nr:helix-turn-helix domain-containing protein [Planctomycetia bacterium]
MEREKENGDLCREGLARIREACDFLCISQALLYRLMDGGQLAYVKIGRARRVPYAALVEFAARGLVGGATK